MRPDTFKSDIWSNPTDNTVFACILWWILNLISGWIPSIKLRAPDIRPNPNNNINVQGVLVFLRQWLSPTQLRQRQSAPTLIPTRQGKQGWKYRSVRMSVPTNRLSLFFFYIFYHIIILYKLKEVTVGGVIFEVASEPIENNRLPILVFFMVSFV